MPFYPITGAAPQFQKKSGGFAFNYYLKFYAANTTTPILCAFNATATSDLGDPLLVDKVRINEYGFPVNPSGSVAIPHLDQGYTYALYKNASDADLNLTANADHIVSQEIKPGLIGFSQAAPVVTLSTINYKADPTAATITTQARLEQYKSVKDFGAAGDGSADDTTAIQTAIASGFNVMFPKGTYLTSGFTCTQNYQSFHFDDATFKAAANNNVIFKHSAAYCYHTGRMIIDSNSKTGVWGLQVGALNQSSTTVLNFCEANRFPAIYTVVGCDELVVLQVGSTVSGTHSDLRDNWFDTIYAKDSKRALWLKSPAQSTGFTSNCNTFKQVIAHNCNTGIQIDDGDLNFFHDILLTWNIVGTSPNASPTGLKIAATNAVTGRAVSRNRFLLGAIFGNSTNVSNSSTSTDLIYVTTS